MITLEHYHSYNWSIIIVKIYTKTSQNVGFEKNLRAESYSGLNFTLGRFRLVMVLVVELYGRMVTTEPVNVPFYSGWCNRCINMFCHKNNCGFLHLYIQMEYLL